MRTRYRAITQSEYVQNRFDHSQCLRHKNGPIPTLVIVNKNHSQVSCVFTEVNLIESDKIVDKQGVVFSLNLFCKFI